MSHSRNCLILVVLLQALKLSLQRRDFYIKFENCSTLKKSKDCEANCTIKEIGRTNRISAYVTTPFVGQKFGMFVDLRTGRNQTTIFHLLVHNLTDACPFLNDKKSNNLLGVILNELKDYARIPTCPVEKGTYHLKDYFIRADHLPLYVPHRPFTLEFIGYLVTYKGEYIECGHFIVDGSAQPIRNLFDKG